MGIIVQKFGGTSVGSAERLHSVAAIIENTSRSRPVIAVVSAMSGTTKAEGTTSLLLSAADSARRSTPFAQELSLVEQLHLRAVQQAIRTDSLRQQTLQFVQEELEKLQRFLEAIAVIRELSPRSQDLVMALGERLSAYVLSAVLRDRGLPSRFVDLSQVVPEHEKEVDPAFFRRLQTQIAKLCHPVADEVPVVTGFLGMVPGGLLHAVGRGYTDFTTAMIAAGLGHGHAEEMQVWKEVDGIFTADPRKVKSARVLPKISPAEAAELTYFGSEVLHPFTMERVVSAQVPIRIKNTFRPDGTGTVITSEPQTPTGSVTAVTVKRGICVVTITSNRMYNAYGFLARVFGALDRHGVVVDLVSTSEVSISCTVDKQSDADRARADLEQLGQVMISTERAILAVVGSGIKDSIGTAGKLFSTLGQTGISVEMISQGASEINISCIVKEKDAQRGLEAIHAAFFDGTQP